MGLFVFPPLPSDSCCTGEQFSVKTFLKSLSVPQLRRNLFIMGLIRSRREGFLPVWRISNREKLLSFCLQLIQSRTQDRLEGVRRGTSSFPWGQGKLSRGSCSCTKEEGMAVLPGREPDIGTRGRTVPLSWDVAVYRVSHTVEGYRWFLLLPQV